MWLLKTLSFRDVGNALVRREFRLAGRITQNLVSNGVSTVQFKLHRQRRVARRVLVSLATRTWRSGWLAGTGLIGAGLQLAGVYAAIVTFGVLVTAAIYVVGGLVALLQHLVVARSQP